MTGRQGSAIVDAMAALVLAGVALTILARAGRTAGAALHTTAETAAVLDLAAARLERLRRWPVPDGTDTLVDASGTSYLRSWSSTGGRGLTRQLSVTVALAGGRRRVTLAGQAFP
jgi:hypothetical protein